MLLLVVLFACCEARLVGVNFAPFTEDEWSFTAWVPLWRVEIDQAQEVTRRGKTTLLLAKAEDDSSVDALMPFLNQSWGIELGNEPDINNHEPGNMNQWYQRMYQKLRGAGYQGNIVTAGVSSLSKKARQWLQKSLVGLPNDMVVGWHGYDNAINNLGQLPGLVGGRRHAMTEFGIPNTSESVEAVVAQECLQNLEAFHQAGALICIWYQMHDGPPNTPQNSFGIRTYDGRWRPVVKSLQTLVNSTSNEI